jgi:hypothetical protein
MTMILGSGRVKEIVKKGGVWKGGKNVIYQFFLNDWKDEK